MGPMMSLRNVWIISILILFIHLMLQTCLRFTTKDGATQKKKWFNNKLKKLEHIWGIEKEVFLGFSLDEFPL